MCLICGRLWTALQILWSTLYVICGAAQLMSGIFFTISVPELPLYNSLVAGSWNIIVGIIAGMVACLWALSPKRQEMLLYLAVSILTVACVNVILTEYWFYKTDMSKLYKNYANHMLIDYACFVSRISTAVVLFVSFLDSQFAFCSMQLAPRNKRNKLKGSHEHVSDIEYIIPRPKNSKPHTHTVYDAYAQSWVFDAVAAAENAGASDATPSTTGDAPYLKVLQNGTPKKPPTKGKQKDTQNGMVTENGHPLLIEQPVVHIEEASDDSTSNSDRKLCHMKSFSRSQSPVVLSAGSSQSSLNLNQPTSSHPPPIYECLEKLTETTIYRSRLNTAVSVKASEDEEDVVQYQTPQTVIMRRAESTTPRAEKVQYASLMKELQKAIVHKKEPPSSGSDSSEKNMTSKSSDADFSKELEAALQLIQDLESPNTAETPSEPARPLAVWRNSDASEKTLSAVGSLTEIATPLTEQPSANGKSVGVVVRYPDSQSTSGYSSPTHGPTPDWSTTSSISGSNPEIKSYSIRNTDSATVISLFSHAKPRSVTLVEISGGGGGGDEDHRSSVRQPPPPHHHIFNSTFADEVKPPVVEAREKPVAAPPTGWKLNSLLRKKKQSSLPKMAPELEGAIVKSESLAYLSDLELLARHQRNKELQREIEKRVVQQLAAPRSARSESNC